MLICIFFSDFEVFLLDIGTCFLDLWSPVGGWGVASSTKRERLDSRVGFIIIFNGFGEPVGSRFLAVYLFFLGLRSSTLNVSSEICFLVGLGETMISGSAVWCVESIASAMVFVRFNFFAYLVNWMISNRYSGVFFIVFWNFGFTFSDSWDSGE